MRLGIFSDVHSNLEALKAALDFFDDADVTQYLFLGDLVGYGTNPNECIELVKRLRCVAIAGNHDYGVLRKTPIDDFNPAAAEALIWTRANLSEDSKFYIDSLELTERFDPFYLVHGSPSSPPSWDYIFALKEAVYEFNYFSSRVCLIGHTHYPFAIEKLPDGTLRMIKEEQFILNDNNRYLINVGSVGQPRDGNPQACVLLYDSRKNQFNFKRLSYDIKTAQQKIISAGLPPYLAYRLAQGR
ncbi:MAG: metallophosphoesterase [bacterium]|nr:metallophosphatase family protein [candidate division WOR-3 bacterium]MDH5683507.1 metallophosphatase family protein [candidate division WOR-3 bacterium]